MRKLRGIAGARVYDDESQWKKIATMGAYSAISTSKHGCTRMAVDEVLRLESIMLMTVMLWLLVTVLAAFFVILVVFDSVVSMQL